MTKRKNPPNKKLVVKDSLKSFGDKKSADATLSLKKDKVVAILTASSPQIVSKASTSSSVAQETPLKKQKTSNPNKPGRMQILLDSGVILIKSTYPQEKVEPMTENFRTICADILKILNDIEIFCHACHNTRLNKEQCKQLLEVVKFQSLIKQLDTIIKSFRNCIDIDVNTIISDILEEGAVCADKSSDEDYLVKKSKTLKIVYQYYVEEFIKNNLELGLTLLTLFSAPSKVIREDCSPSSMVSEATSSSSKREFIILD